MAKNKKRKLPPSAPKSSDDIAVDAPVTGDDAVADADADADPEVDAVADAEADPRDDVEEDEHDDQTLENASAKDPVPPTAAVAGDDDDVDDLDAVEKLLEPFSKSQIVELLRDAAVKHRDVLKGILQIADADPAHRKIFVHGLGWDTNADVLRAVFGEFGEIEDCKAVADKVTGKSKGYGFILFKHRAGANRALKEPQKKIGNRMTACQLASAGPVPPSSSSQQQGTQAVMSEVTQRKIFVSNVGAEVDPQKLLRFFAEFGEIEEGPLGLDKATGKPKGFALFIYKSVESAKKALEEPHKNFEGSILHCQKAIDGLKPNKTSFQSQVGTAQYGGSGFGVGSHSYGYARNDNAAMNQFAGAGHLMAPPAAGLGFNQAGQISAEAATGLNPALGQALNAILASQGGGGFGSTVTGVQTANPGFGGQLMNNTAGYPGQVPGVAAGMNAMMGGYGAVQSGYANATAGRGAGMSQHGLNHMGGMRPYRG